MKVLAKRLAIPNAVRAFHQGEEGMETLQVVVIIAIAALVIGLLSKFIGSYGDGQSSGSNGTIAGWVQSQLTNLFGTNYTSGNSGSSN